jgi:cytochrome c-type biogenesis protein CcmH
VTRRSFPLWTALGVVLVAALIIGSGALSGSPPTDAQRAYAIESVVRCPSCEDLSVAQSSASTAVTVRATVTQLISSGWTDQQIENYLVARYGTSIVLDPPARGLSLLVWLLPLLGGSAALAVLVTRMARRQGSSDGIGDGGSSDRLLDATSRAERKRFLEQSLADADAEYLAGDLSDQDYLALRRRDMARLASLDPVAARGDGAVGERGSSSVIVADEPNGSQIGAVPGGPDPVAAEAAAKGVGEPRPPTRRARSRRSWWFLGGAVAAFGAALVVAVSLFATNRLPGQTETGSISLSQPQQIEETLAQAAAYQNEGQASQAAQLYRTVLTEHPDNEVALAQLGWLEYETGQQGKSSALVSDGRAMLDRAVKIDPGDYAVRLYLGTVLLQQDGDAAGAVAQYRLFLDDGPPAALVQQAGPEISEAYRRAGLPLPSALAGG